MHLMQFSLLIWFNSISRLHDKLRLAETRDGASFYTLFGPAIQLGVVSRRKAYNDTIQYEKDRNAGFLSPFGYSTPTVKAAVDAICSMEVLLFHIFSILFPMPYLCSVPELFFTCNNLFVYMAVVLALGIEIPSICQEKLSYKNLEMEGLSCAGILLTFLAYAS